MVVGGLGAARRALAAPLGWYLRLTPFARGRTRLMSLGSRILGMGPHGVRCRDGRRFQLQFPKDRGWESLYFLRTFETGTTRTLRKILRADDVTFDVGANIGWYTTLFAQVCPKGRCHTFEPLPLVFEELTLNCTLNEVDANVTFNKVAVGDEPGDATIYAAPGMPHTYASVSRQVVPEGLPIRCQITTLDRYVRQQRARRVDLVKVDVEGAELMVLKGATDLIGGANPPAWLLEVNSRTSAAFGYRPPDLFTFLAGRGRFHFFRIPEGWGELAEMRSPEDCVHADNVLCVPEPRLDRLEQLQ